MARYKAKFQVTTVVDCEAGKDLSTELRSLLQTIFPEAKVQVGHKHRLTEVLGEFSPEEVLPFALPQPQPRETCMRREYVVNGETHKVRMCSSRYLVFQESRKCAACGLEGTKMLLERPPGSVTPHFNLYAEENGRLVLMTKDHVLPASKGGRNDLNNLQTYCAVCNTLKANFLLTPEEVGRLRKVYDDNKGTLGKKTLADLVRKTRQDILDNRAADKASA